MFSWYRVKISLRVLVCSSFNFRKFSFCSAAVSDTSFWIFSTFDPTPATSRLTPSTVFLTLFTSLVTEVILSPTPANPLPTTFRSSPTPTSPWFKESIFSSIFDVEATKASLLLFSFSNWALASAAAFFSALACSIVFANSTLKASDSFSVFALSSASCWDFFFASSKFLESISNSFLDAAFVCNKASLFFSISSRFLSNSWASCCDRWISCWLSAITASLDAICFSFSSNSFCLFAICSSRLSFCSSRSSLSLLKFSKRVSFVASSSATTSS